MKAPYRTVAPKVVLTGGGTAGHVMPHIALLPLMKNEGWELFYLGSKGIEKNLIEPLGIPFYQIQVGKLRRYFSLENMTDIFRLLIGIIQSFWYLMRIKPQLVFSKGGFVSVPVSIAAKVLRIPVVTHESDLTPGLANRIISRFSNLILTSFPETERFLQKYPSRLVGIPVRHELLEGNLEEGLKICGFKPDLPRVLVMGGSLGAQRINDALLKALPSLVERFQVIHITGQGKALDYQHSNYKGFEFLGGELKHVFAAADVIVSRSGANSIFEFLRLEKPMILIPLEFGSRGDQVDNAACFERNGYAKVLREADLNSSSLESSIEELVKERETLSKKFHNRVFPESPEDLVLQCLVSVMAKSRS